MFIFVHHSSPRVLLPSKHYMYLMKSKEIVPLERKKSGGRHNWKLDIVLLRSVLLRSAPWSRYTQLVLGFSSAKQLVLRSLLSLWNPQVLSGCFDFCACLLSCRSRTAAPGFWRSIYGSLVKSGRYVHVRYCLYTILLFDKIHGTFCNQVWL